MSIIKKTIFLFFLFALSGSAGEAQGRKPATTINITQFKVYESKDQLIVEWATDALIPVNYWEVERSTDGARFSSIAIVLGADPCQPGNRYLYKEQVGKGRNPGRYYRLCHVASDGTRQYSEIYQPAK